MRKLKAVWVTLLLGLTLSPNIHAEISSKILPSLSDTVPIKAGRISTLENEDVEKSDVLNEFPSVSESEVRFESDLANLPDTEPKSILKTVGAWALIVVGIFLCLSIVSHNFEVPTDYDANFKSKRLLHVRSKRKKYKL